MDTQHKLAKIIQQAWDEYDEIHNQEKEDGYSDAMLSMERTHAEGYAEGLESAYKLFFGEEYSNV